MQLNQSTKYAFTTNPNDDGYVFKNWTYTSDPPLTIDEWRTFFGLPRESDVPDNFTTATISNISSQPVHVTLTANYVTVAKIIGLDDMMFRVLLDGNGNYSEQTKPYTLENIGQIEASSIVLTLGSILTCIEDQSTYTTSTYLTTEANTSLAGSTSDNSHFAVSLKASTAGKLSEGTYQTPITLSYNDGSGRIKTATAEMTITVVTPNDLGTSSVTVEDGQWTYTGNAITPAVTVKDIYGTTLTAGTDYTVTYENNVNAGNAAKITITGTGSKGSGYYNSKSVYFTIAKAKLSVESFSLNAKQYNKANDAVVASVTFGGEQNGEQLALGDDYTATAAFGADVNAGSAREATLSAVALTSSPLSANYEITSGVPATLPFDIAPAPLTIAVAQGDLVYGHDPAPALSITAGELFGNDAVGDAADLTFLQNPDGGAAPLSSAGHIAAGSYTTSVGAFAINDGNGGANYDLSLTGGAFTVSPLGISVSGDMEAVDREYDGTTTVELSGGTPEGTLNGDKVALSHELNGTMYDRHAYDTAKVVVFNMEGLIGDDHTNYTLEQPRLTVTIRPAPLTASIGYRHNGSGTEGNDNELPFGTEVYPEYQLTGGQLFADDRLSGEPVILGEANSLGQWQVGRHIVTGKNGAITVVDGNEGLNYRLTVIDTAFVIITSDAPTIETIEISDISNTSGKPRGQAPWVVLCPDNGADDVSSVTVTVNAPANGRVVYNGRQAQQTETGIFQFAVDVSRVGIYHEWFTCTPAASTPEERIDFVIVKNLASNNVVSHKFDNALFVDKVALRKLGYGEISSYQWFVNDVPVSDGTGNGQVYSVGPSLNHLLNEDAHYSVALTFADTGDSLRVCPYRPTLTLSRKYITVYPNPVAHETSFTIAILSDSDDIVKKYLGKTISIFSANGVKVYESTMKKPKTEVNIDLNKGVYLIHINGEVLKLMVK